jgi:hypothetical protein
MRIEFTVVDVTGEKHVFTTSDFESMDAATEQSGRILRDLNSLSYPRPGGGLTMIAAGHIVSISIHQAPSPG